MLLIIRSVRSLRPSRQLLRARETAEFEEEAGGLLINAETRQPFSYKDACVVHGAHVGHDPTATQAAKTAVKAFLRTVFKLD